MRILFASSEVGLGHITRDLYLAKRMTWARITWLTSGLALRYLEAKGVEIHPASYLREDLGRYVEALFVNGVLKPSYSGLVKLVDAGRRNAETILSSVNLSEYDVVLADESWDFVASDGIGCKSVFITDFVRFKPQASLLQYLALPFVNRELAKALRKFDLKIYVGLDPRLKTDDFEFYGQIFTHDYEVEVGGWDGAVINLGGTSAGNVLLEKAVPVLKRLGVDYKILGPEPHFVVDPLSYLASSKLVLTLGGYSTLLEVARFKRRAVITPLGRDFEQRDNARMFEGRSGYRVIPLDRVDEEVLLKYVKEVLDETPEPPVFTDGSEAIASKVRLLAED
ncbi:MAG: glycosyltransferase [Nitrososphaerales archaeon]